MISKFPEKLIRKKILDLKDGESGYTVPWALRVTETLGCFIQSNMEIKQEKGGTYAMLVSLTPKGFIVDIRECEFLWDKEPNEYFIYHVVPVYELIYK